MTNQANTSTTLRFVIFSTAEDSTASHVASVTVKHGDIPLFDIRDKAASRAFGLAEDAFGVHGDCSPAA